VYEPRTWTNLGAIFLPGLTTARHENRKILYENELLKAKGPAPDVYKCRIYRMIPKKHTTKSRETIPLNSTPVDKRCRWLLSIEYFLVSTINI
jgi:hypothetical protein